MSIFHFVIYYYYYKVETRQFYSNIWEIVNLSWRYTWSARTAAKSGFKQIQLHFENRFEADGTFRVNHQKYPSMANKFSVIHTSYQLWWSWLESWTLCSTFYLDKTVWSDGTTFKFSGSVNRYKWMRSSDFTWLKEILIAFLWGYVKK